MNIDYGSVTKSLMRFANTRHESSVLQVRLPSHVVDTIDFIAQQRETNRSAIVRDALIDYFNKKAISA
jgi:metal-responsive CopG/Arc/MetJ family transcriptional regulator